ncbi:hypothetical protein ALC60_14287 [Trachymyrmex zeteki]|uniref:Uncharacterized protein n=1 Tax=Mycetomoellerius zeteki TaxID=64791 RepID=A0A151WG44_9HYME|nr:hypothetical protein ALC60_14287 [Trachymyrmex zeteki]
MSINSYHVNLYLTKSVSCLKIPVRINSTSCTVTIFGALARNFFAFGKSSLRDKIIALSGHLAGGRGGPTFGVNTMI